MKLSLFQTSLPMPADTLIRAEILQHDYHTTNVVPSQGHKDLTTSSPPPRWQCPPLGQYKVNIGADFKKDVTVGGIVIRDPTCDVLICAAQPLPPPSNISISKSQGSHLFVLKQIACPSFRALRFTLIQ